MKVWVVSHAYAAPINHDKLERLARLPDVELTVLAPRVWRSAFGEVRLLDRQTPYRSIGARVLWNGRIGAYVYVDGIGEMRRARPDVVHAEVEPWSLAALQCLVGARRAALVLFTWENLEGPSRPLARLIERLMLRRAAFVIAGNEAARARVTRLGVPRERTVVLPQFGVDLERYQPRAHDAAAGETGEASRPDNRATARPPAIGYVGRLVPEKGLDLLVDAVASLDARLIVVGDGPVRADLERRAADWPQGKATFAGAVDHAAVPALLSELDVLVLPSRTTPIWAEQFGHVLIEAMAAGVAVVGSSSGAIPEVIGDAGLVFREGAVADLRTTLEKLLTDEPARRAVGARGRARVAERFTNEAIASAQQEIYRRVLRRS